MELNIAIFKWLHGFAHSSPIVDEFIRFATDPLGVLIVIIVAWYLLRHETHTHGLWELGAFFGIAFLSAGVSYALKEIFQTLRPGDFFEYLDPLIDVGGAAFPSMHTAFYSALGGAMIVGHRRSGALVILLAIIIGVARVMAGVHWPYDIFFGALFGVIIGWSTMKLLYQGMCRLLKVCII
jgi:undecaprenyl-diphosphatase